MIFDEDILCTCLFMAEFTDADGERMEHRFAHSNIPLTAEQLVAKVGQPEWAVYARCHAFPYDPGDPDADMNLEETDQ